MHPWQQSQKHKPGHDGRPNHLQHHPAFLAVSLFVRAFPSWPLDRLPYREREGYNTTHMKDRRGSSGGVERFAVFPFSMGCMSQSAVSVADPSEKKPQGDPSSSSATATTTARTAGSSEDGAGETVKEKAAVAAASPGLVAAGVSRLMKGIKSLSLMFAGDGGDEEEEEREMVIGYPTDVQHVGHIGWDGHNKVGAMGMVNAFSLPSSLSLRQLEMAMDQAAHASA
ncbi:hypothetical protein GQ55_9G011500 [Panicum hallii var. hallii]|uniref:CRIB domain-containing protein n=1 Tax=Panicum hallii var. hallii TaxID=1504633 RepID=A0A2T7BYB9_9POAL|nr:hypothetical protein GQ55_9G011500 [Panicum hallii var. hallii]